MAPGNLHTGSAPNVTFKPGPGPWRRYVRFSLRGLIVLVLLFGGWLGWIVRSARIQREAVAAIRNVDGEAFYEWEWNNGRVVAGGAPWAPHWLVQTFGVDYFGHVVAVFTPIAAEDELIHIEQLPQLRHLVIGNTEVTDATLTRLKRLTHLSKLDLGNSEITDAGANDLKRALPGLVIFY